MSRVYEEKGREGREGRKEGGGWGEGGRMKCGGGETTNRRRGQGKERRGENKHGETKERKMRKKREGKGTSKR